MSLQGTLSTLGTTEVLEFLASRDFSGQLDIETRSGTASYLLIDGTIGVAEYEFGRGAGIDAAEATYYALADVDGTFYFEPHDVDGVEPGESIDELLARAAGIAERWEEVEKQIPSTEHVLMRNSELDASVMIQPEWWKVLEVLGKGKTTQMLAFELDLGILECSTQALEMLEAGLLVVSDDVEASNETSTDGATPEYPEAIAVAEEHVAAPAQAVPEMVAEEAPDAFEAPDAYEAPDVYNVDEVSAESVAAAPPVADEAAIAMAPEPPIMAEQAEAVAPVVGFSAGGQVDDVAPALDDEGWSTNPYVPEVDTVVPASAVEQTAVAPEYLSVPEEEEVVAPMSFDAPISFDQEDTFDQGVSFGNEESFDAPTSFDGTMSFDPTAADSVEEADTSSLYGLDAPFAETAETIETPVPESSALANEVMDDLAYLDNDLDEQLSVPEAVASVPAQASPIAEDAGLPSPVPSLGENDPFGALSDLVVEEELEEDRGSVLKFLRRD